MLRVLIIDRCEYCNDEAYLYAGEYKDGDVERPVFRPCTVCKGSGAMEKQVTLFELQVLLDKANSMEPDYAELAKEKPISQYQDSREAAGI
jgi:hypothetical protein